MLFYEEIIEKLKKLNGKLYQTDFLLTLQKSKEELQIVLLLAEALKFLHNNNVSTNCFSSGIAITNFSDKSTSTRFPFLSACNLLGLVVQDLDESKSHIKHPEIIRETANVISFLTEIIGLYNDKYIGEGNKNMQEYGVALDEGFRNNSSDQKSEVRIKGFTQRQQRLKISIYYP